MASKWGVVGVGLTISLGSFAPAQAETPVTRPHLELAPCTVPGVKETLRCGTLSVPENRITGKGRRLPLKVVVLPARKTGPNKGPVYFFAGGPGDAETPYASMFADLWERDEHDVVLMDERGRGEGHLLKCKLPFSAEDPRTYLKPPYSAANARMCVEQLEPHADLRQYSTWNSIADIEDLRQALGHGQINIEAGSGGTYTALMYIKAYPRNVRTAFLYSLSPPENLLPLYHADAAQSALDELFRQCESDAPCRKRFPTFRSDVREVLARARQGPLQANFQDSQTGKTTAVTLPYDTVADTLRIMMYDGGTRVPLVFWKARKGDYSALAKSAVEGNKGLYAGGRLGSYLAIACNEFTNRITAEEAVRLTRGRFLGDVRLRAQQAACSEWPRFAPPQGFFAPFQAEVPTVMISGKTDPATRPYWYDVFRKYLPNNVHLIIPGGHTPANECTDAAGQKLFSQGSLAGIDTACAETSRPRPFDLGDATSGERG